MRGNNLVLMILKYWLIVLNIERLKGEAEEVTLQATIAEIPQ